MQATGEFYRLDFKGYPIILCPDPETARAIHASVDVMPDGTVCFHKHQVAAWKLLQQYKRRPASDFAVKVEPLATWPNVSRSRPQPVALRPLRRALGAAGNPGETEPRPAEPLVRLDLGVEGQGRQARPATPWPTTTGLGWKSFDRASTRTSPPCTG